MANELRLDAMLAAKGLVKSRQRAKVLIEEGKVTLDGIRCIKPSRIVADTVAIEIVGEQLRYVGRGGLKLEAAISRFNLALEGCICIDIGASTGGFTDCMLQNGAKRVYAVDVGTAQLDESLLCDERVISLEQTDIRDVEIHEKIPEQADFIAADVSFISLALILPQVKAFLKPDGCCVLLIKPQFEAGRENIGKNGIVKSPKVHSRVLCNICAQMAEAGLAVQGLAPSPIKGGENNGNIEYLAFAKMGGTQGVLSLDGKAIDNIVHEAFQ